MTKAVIHLDTISVPSSDVTKIIHVVGIGWVTLGHLKKQVSRLKKWVKAPGTTVRHHLLGIHWIIDRRYGFYRLIGTDGYHLAAARLNMDWDSDCLAVPRIKRGDIGTTRPRPARSRRDHSQWDRIREFTLTFTEVRDMIKQLDACLAVEGIPAKKRKGYNVTMSLVRVKGPGQTGDTASNAYGYCFSVVPGVQASDGLSVVIFPIWHDYPDISRVIPRTAVMDTPRDVIQFDRKAMELVLKGFIREGSRACGVHVVVDPSDDGSRMTLHRLWPWSDDATPLRNEEAEAAQPGYVDCARCTVSGAKVFGAGILLDVVQFIQGDTVEMVCNLPTSIKRGNAATGNLPYVFRTVDDKRHVGGFCMAMPVVVSGGFTKRVIYVKGL